MSTVHRVSVRSLAEFALEGGDLSREGMMIDRMQDGLRGHQELQSRYTDGFRSEVPVRLRLFVEGIDLLIIGRIDGLNEAEQPPIVEEIKTTAADVKFISDDQYPVHWAQAELYAHIIAVTRGAERVTVKLTYYNLGGDSSSFTRTYTAQVLETRFYEMAVPYAQWLTALDQWAAISRPSMMELPFPFKAYRYGQREMATNSFVAFRDKKKLLCQAPTGIGKTAATLFPAFKALGENHVTHIFYLTARTTTRGNAEEAVERMRGDGLIARSVTITAKDKICPHPNARCVAEECPLARGYYDRRRQAMMKSLTLQNLNRPGIEALAREFELCPFELSLDVSETADVIICDYNYAFDPAVRLRRFFLDGGDYALLVDEAHNLIDRARDFLSAVIDLKLFESLRRQVGKEAGRKHGLYISLTQLLKVIREVGAGVEGPTVLDEAPISLEVALELFLEVAKEGLSQPAGYGAELLDRYFDALYYLRAVKRYDEKYRTLILPEEKQVVVKLWCFDPSNYLKECMDAVHGSVLFSATLSPMMYYADMLGLSDAEGDAFLDLPSPFPPENLLVTRLNITTKYRKREESADAVARALIAMCRAKTGNYIACFPSHAYIQLLTERLTAYAGDIDIVRQYGSMREEDRAAFLDNFQPNPKHTMLALIAMGGVFSEGVDLPGDRLSGAAIVGVGIPQIGFERNALSELLDDYGEGYQYAYVYPGIERVLQAAGRVIRTEADRGCVLLIDDRFAQGEYPMLLPRHWQVRPARNMRALKEMLERFWRGEQS